MATRSSYVVLVSLLHLAQLSFARFVFQFQLHAVTLNGECPGIEVECETYLHRFCLRAAGSSRTNFDDSDCPLGSSDQFGPNADDTLPVTRVISSEQSWPGRFLMFIRAYDQDIGFDDHLDNIFIEMQLEESNNFTAIEQFTGDMNKVSINMSFRVRMCPENYYGIDCDIMCIAQNDSINGYYTCNDDGSIQCRPGFRNVSNDCRDVDPCTPTPCANNGNCMVTGLLNYTCECTPGYTGPTCDDEIDGCPKMTCPNNSVCDSVNGSKCVCLSGFQLNGGMCVELPTGVSDQPGTNDGQIGAPVIIGSAAGGAVLFILVLLILVVVMAVIVASYRRKSQSRHGKIPAIPEHGSLIDQSPDHNKDTLKFEMTKKASVKREDSMEDNPVYNQVSPAHSPQPPQQESSVSDSSSPNIHDTLADSNEPTVSVAPNPVYGVSQTSSGSPRPHRSTIRHVQNPVYGDSSDGKMDGNVYSTPHQLSTQSNGDDIVGQLEYSYAAVDVLTSGAATQQQAPAGGTLQPTKTVVEHEYAMVDKSTKTSDVDVAPHSHTRSTQPYDQLKHEQCTDNQAKLQTTIRLAEDQDLGYSVLT